MAKKSNEELRRRYSRVASGKDETQAMSKETGSATTADRLRARYATRNQYNTYTSANRTPSRYDGSAVLRYMNAYGLNQQRQADRQQEARNRYNQQQFMNTQRDLIRNGYDNGNNPLGLKNLDNPLDRQRRINQYEEQYNKTHNLSLENAQKLEKAYGNADRQQLEKLKEHFETAKDRDYSGELEWVKNKLLTTATGKENEARQSVLKKQISSADERLQRLYDTYAKKNIYDGKTDEFGLRSRNIEDDALKSPEYQAKKEAIEKEKKSLENELMDYQENINYRDSDDFEKYKEKGDKDSRNAVRFYRNNTDQEIADYWENQYWNRSTTQVPEQYAKDFENDKYNKAANYYTGRDYMETSDQDLFRAITDEEADNYSYILGKYGEDKANEYLQNIAKHTDVNGALTKMQEAQKEGASNPIKATAESIGLGALTPFEAIKNATGFGGEFRTYDDYKLAGRQEALRSGVAQNIANTTGDDTVLPFLYNTATSTADNLLRYAVGGGVGALSGNAGAAEGTMRLMMGGQVMDSAMKQALDRGLTDSEAVTTAIISAINEELFETISIEKLKSMQLADPQNYRELAKNVGKQILAEGSEEVFTDIGNAIADDLVNGEKSEIATNIRKYMDQGLSEEEAKKKAAVDFAMQLVESGLSGGLSGAAMGGAVTVSQFNDIDNQKRYNKLAEAYMDAGMSAEDAYSAAYNDALAGIEEKYDENGNVVKQTGLKKSLNQAVKSAAVLNENIQRLENEMNSGVVDNAMPINDAEIRYNEAQNEYLDDLKRVLDTKVKNDEDYSTVLNQADALAEKYPERRNDIARAVDSVFSDGANKEQVLEDLRTQTTNTKAENETSLKQPINASEVGVANNETTKMEFKAAVNGNEGTITSVNNDKITIKDATGNEQTVKVKDAEMSDGAKAAVEQAKQYGKRGSKLYLANLTSDNVRKYTLAFNTFYNAGKNGKTFYGNKTLGVNPTVLREAYYAGVADNSKSAKQGGLIKNEARYKINEAEARVLDAMGKKYGVTVQIDNMISNDANGLYDSDNDIIHISANAENPALVVFSHEFTHRLEETSPDAYKEYEDYVIDYLKKVGIYESREQSLKQLYKNAGIELSEKDVRSEIAANATETFLTDTEAIEAFVANNKTLAEKIIDVIKNMIADLKDSLSNFRNPKSVEAQAIRNGIDSFDKALELWIKAAESQEAKTESDKTQFSLKEMSDKELEKSYDEAVNKLYDMNLASEIVKQYAYNKGFTKELYHGTSKFGFTKLDTKYSDDNLSFFTSDNPELAGTYSGYGNKKKIYEYTNIDKMNINEVVKAFNNLTTKELKNHPDYVNEKFNAKITSDNKIDIEGYGEHDLESAKTFLKRIKLNNDGVYSFYGNLDNMLEIDAKNNNWNQIPIDNKENEIINKLKSYNKLLGDSGLSSASLRYLSTIVGNLVDFLNYNFIVAEENNENIKNKESLLKAAKELDDIKNNWVEKEHLDNDGKPLNFYNYVKNNLPKRYTTRQIAKMAKEDGYDGVIIKNVYDNGGQNVYHSVDWDDYEEYSKGNLYNFFNPQEQLKSADPVTYDDKGNVIPLSERFNKSNDDIRYSIKERNQFTKETGFDIATLENPTPEDITWYASRKENAINKYLENRNIKIEPVIKNKEIDNSVLDSDIIKKYIVDNDIDFVKLVSDSDLRDKFINYIQNGLIDKAEKVFIKNIYTKKLEAIKAAIEGDDYLDGYWKYNSDKLIEDLENIKNPKEEENKIETLEKKQKYVEEHYKDFEDYIYEKIEKILGWNVSGEKEKATDEDIERHVEDAVNRFGTLKGDKKDWVLAGYITANGDVLNFGSKGSDSRTHDHRDISAVYDDDESTKLRLFTPTDYLNQFLSEGNIRIMAESSSADFNSNNEPTTEQYNLIRDYIEDYAADTGKFIIEFSDDDGKSVDSKYYENNINSSQIINDIKRFYREGKIGGSNLNQFRFSLKEESNITRNDVATLTGKDEYMAEAVKDLEDIMKMKGGEAFFRANQKELYKIYDEIANEYNIKDYSKKMFADNVKELFDYIQSTDNPDGVDITMLGMQIAADMLDKGTMIDNSFAVEYPTLQDEIRNYKIKIADQDKADLDGGYNTFRKNHFGSLTLANDGTEVDSVYEDLAASYPELFTEDITHPADRLTRIADVADMFKKTVDHIEGATREESAFIIAQDIINKAVLEQTKNNKSIDSKKRVKAQEKVRKQSTDIKKAKKDIHDEYVRLQKKVKALESINERLSRKLTKAENDLGRQKKEFADWAMGKRQVNKEDKYYKQRYDKLKEEFAKKKVAELQKKYSAERRKNIEKIRKMVNELDRSVRNPNKKHYVPKYLIKSMLDVLRTIDLDSGYRKPDGSETLVYMKLKEMQKQYQAMQEDMDYAISSEYNETIDKAIGRLAEITKGKRLNELLDKDIADVVDIMEIITYQMKTARQLLENEKLDDVKAASAKAREQIKESGRVFNSNATIKNLFNRYINNSLSPVRVMKRLEGYAHDGVLSSLGEELQQGERTVKEIRQTANDMLSELYKDSKAIKRLEKFRSEKLVYNVGGKNIIITPDMRAAIYLHSLNEQNMKHVIGNKTKEGSYRGGGIIIPNYKKQLAMNKNDVKVNAAEKYTGQDAVRLSESDVQRIINDMTDYDKHIVELYKEVNDYLTKHLNDATMKLYGFKKATVKNYFPLIVDKSILNLDSDVLKFDKTLESFGFLKERVNSAKPIYLEGVMDALERQIEQSSLFSGMAVPSRDFKKVWNYASLNDDDKFDNVNKQAQKSMGSYIDRYVQNLQADLAQARERGTPSELLGAFSRGKMATGVLTGNVSVVLKQAASYPTAAGGVLGFQDLLSGLLPKGQRGKTLEKTMNKYTPLYQDRNTAAITGVNINDMNVLKRRNPKLYYALTGWIEAMDKATVRRLWYASENYVKRNFKYEVGSDDYYEEVAKVWEDTIRRTQPIYDTMNRPEYLRQTNEVLKYLMMFKTQALQNVGIMVENWGEMRARKRDLMKDDSDYNKKEFREAKHQFNKAVLSQIIQSVIFTGITALVDAFVKHRPEEWADEETGLLTPESLRDNLIDAWTSNVIGQLAFGDIIRDTIYYPAKTAITGKESSRFDLTVAPIEAINEMINGINNATTAAVNNDYDKAVKNIKKVAQTASQYGLGLPVKNIENLYKGLNAYIKDIEEGKNPLEASNEKQMYNRVYIAYQSGDKVEAEKLSKDLDQDKLKTKMVSKLKDEETIQEAADYRYNSDLVAYQAIVDAYVKLGFNEDWVVSAINSDMNKKYGTKGSVSKGSTYNSSDLNRAIEISAVQGSKVAQELYNEKYNTYIAEGMSKEDAKKKAMSSVKASITSEYKPKFESGSTSEKIKIRDRLSSIKVNGEKLYTYDSIKKWNK